MIGDLNVDLVTELVRRGVAVAGGDGGSVVWARASTFDYGHLVGIEVVLVGGRGGTVKGSSVGEALAGIVDWIVR
jgi:pseudouridine-5'-phosphate glycosidase